MMKIASLIRNQNSFCMNIDKQSKINQVLLKMSQKPLKKIVKVEEKYKKK